MITDLGDRQSHHLTSFKIGVYHRPYYMHVKPKIILPPDSQHLPPSTLALDSPVVLSLDSTCKHEMPPRPASQFHVFNLSLLQYHVADDSLALRNVLLQDRL